MRRIPSDTQNGFRAVFKEILNRERNPQKKRNKQEVTPDLFKKAGKGRKLYLRKIRRATELLPKWGLSTFEID